MSNEFSTDDQFQVEDHAYELKARKQWVCWQYREKAGKDKPNKVPVNLDNLNGPGLSYTRPENWMSYEEAVAFLQADDRIDGIGFVTHKGDPYCFLDLDEYPDEKTEEASDWIFQLADSAVTYSHYTPNGGLRIVGKGALEESGGRYYWTNPLTRKTHQLEAYDKSRMLAFTNHVYLNLRIGYIQPLLDSLRKAGKTRSFGQSHAERADIEEVPLTGGLKKSRDYVKSILIRNGIDPSPVVEQFRRDFLLSALPKIFHAGASKTDLWKIANQINDTMFYSKDGQLKGLPADELSWLHSYALVHRNRSSYETLVKLEEIREFLIAIKPYTRRDRDPAWKLLMGLIDHGAKHGSISGNDVLVECSWLELKKKSKIGSDQTVDKWLKELDRSDVVQYSSYYSLENKIQEKRSSSYIIRVDTLLSGVFFNVNEIVENIVSCRSVNNPYLPFSTTKYVYWRNGIGDAVSKVILALESLQGEANTGDIALAMGRINNRGKGNSGSISVLIKRLVGWGVIEKVSHGRYKLADNYELKMFEACDLRGEFDRDEKYEAHKQDRRKRWKELLKYRKTQSEQCRENVATVAWDLSDLDFIAV